MSVYIDRKYLLLISSRLRNYKQSKEDLYKFACPYCGDSKKNSSKTRGYVYRKANDYFYMCHNCNVSTTFGKFLQYMDAEQYKQYVFERYANGENGKANYKKPANNEIQTMLTGPKPQDRLVCLKDITDTTIADLPDGHYAKQYIINRKIPEKFWQEMLFVDDYGAWLDKTFPNHGKDKDKLPNDPRIVLFYTSFNGTITNVAGRALIADEQLRYVTVKISEDKKVFGLHRMNPDEPVYVVEGQFDSMFLPNAVASGDSNLIGLAEYLAKTYSIAPILVYDNQPRNKELVKQIGVAIDEGHTVALLPYDPDAKDINEMIKGGMSLTDVKCLIDNNLYQGLSAKMHFVNWRKC